MRGLAKHSPLADARFGSGEIHPSRRGGAVVIEGRPIAVFHKRELSAAVILDPDLRGHLQT